MPWSLPTTATAPFCPSEVRGTIAVPRTTSFFKKLLLFAGPGLLISVGYMDPGNWATDIEAGSRFGYGLLFIILISNLVAILLQCLCVRVGIVTQRDLAQLAKDAYSKQKVITLWLLAELAIIATDVAEVLGSALAFKLLFGCSLKWGIAITALDTFIVLGLKGKGFRQVEAIILGLVLTIGICFAFELFLIHPDMHAVLQGLIPNVKIMTGLAPWYLAIGILGATVMPHNLYLHSSIVQTRKIEPNDDARASAIRLGQTDTIVSLCLAFFINAAILILAAAAVHVNGHQSVTEIDQAYHLLDPIVGTSLAGILFGVALLAAGQSSTFTGTIAGQIIMDGFLNLKIPCWKRRVITRGLALIPAYIGVAIVGDSSTGKLLVLTQVILSLQLPFAIYPLVKFASSEKLMGRFRIRGFMKLSSWFILVMVSAANLWLVYQFVFGDNA